MTENYQPTFGEDVINRFVIKLGNGTFDPNNTFLLMNQNADDTGVLTPKASYNARNLLVTQVHVPQTEADMPSVISMYHLNDINDLLFKVDSDERTVTLGDDIVSYRIMGKDNPIIVDSEMINQDAEALFNTEDIDEDWFDPENEHFNEMAVRTLVRCALVKMAEQGIDSGFPDELVQ